ncbi:Thioredoxin family protein [Histomonas meleagridis]|uniref:Thioredoxin family protein n=1 Tax=Histomonas meleagridis TaxID=135588 RepID=UPI00355A143D|nr:Thioredoxin family protein [Histomonas meleagridis]KAH0800043.1 Thioredoxin family protein [Histomonas meleagridis]
MLFAFLLAIRFPNPIGEATYLDEIDDSKIEEFIQSHNRSVIIFQKDNYVLDYMDYGIYRYRDQINIALASYEKSNLANCVFSPCIAAFSQGKHISNFAEYPTPTEFAGWLREIMNPKINNLEYPEQLRRFLSLKGAHIIGVDTEEVPQNIPEDETFYNTSSSLFKFFDMKVDKGVYVYRFSDRQLIPYNGNFDDLKDSHLVNLNLFKSMEKPFFGGFITNDDNTTRAEEEISILDKLAVEFIDKANFVIADDYEGRSIIKKASLENAQAPYFFLLNSTDLGPNRWLIQNIQKQSNYTFIESFVRDAIDGKINFSKVSAQFPDEPPEVVFRQLTAVTFEEAVNQNDTDVLVVITAPWCGHCKHFKPVLNATAQMVVNKTDKIKFYWIDGTLNELPESFPNFDGYPTMFMWPAGKKRKEDVISFDEDRTIESIIKFLNESATTNISEYDFDFEAGKELQKKIADS